MIPFGNSFPLNAGMQGVWEKQERPRWGRALGAGWGSGMADVQNSTVGLFLLPLR